MAEEGDEEGKALYLEFVGLIGVGALVLVGLGLLCQRLPCFWKWRAARRLKSQAGVDSPTTLLSVSRLPSLPSPSVPVVARGQLLTRGVCCCACGTGWCWARLGGVGS